MMINEIIKVLQDGFLAMPIESMSEITPCRGATSGLFFPSKIASHYCGMNEFTVGDIMAYGFLRFGYPVNDWDDYKQLCQWIVRTPMEGVFLTVQPTTLSPFGYLIKDPLTNDLSSEIYNETYRKRNEFSFDLPIWDTLPKDSLERQINETLHRTIVDMKRPVSIRDWQIDLMGRCSGEGFREFEEDDDGYEEIKEDYFAPTSAMAGYGLHAIRKGECQ